MKQIILTYFPTSLGAKFKPLFVSFTYSRYDEEKVVWRADLTAIGFCMERHDDEIMDVVQTAIIDDPHNEMVVHLTNPCHHGFIFSAFQIGESLSQSLMTHTMRWLCILQIPCENAYSPKCTNILHLLLLLLLRIRLT